ncbi:MAG: hypothetical protein HRT47_02405 [Candidatus Caenarcaniphilales bacterium]|nr:hypothetical protein [Candidatus Caenarcaniphilales bacterium]
MVFSLPSLPFFGNKNKAQAVNTQQQNAAANQVVPSNLSNQANSNNRNNGANLARTMVDQAHDPQIRQMANFNPETPMFSPSAVPIASTPKKIQSLLSKELGIGQAKKDEENEIDIAQTVITQPSHMNNTETGENIDQYVIQLPPKAAANLLAPSPWQRTKNFFKSLIPFRKKEFDRSTIKELKKKLHTNKVPDLKQKLLDGAIKAQIIVNYDKNKDSYSVDVLGLSKKPEEFLLEDKKAIGIIKSLKKDIPQLKKKLLKEYAGNNLAQELIKANFIGLEEFTSDANKSKEAIITSLEKWNEGDKLAVLEAMRDEKERRLDGAAGPKIDKSNLAMNLMARPGANYMPEINTVAIKGKNLETESTDWIGIDPDTKEIKQTKHSFLSTRRKANMFYSPINTLFSSLTELMFNGDKQISEKKIKEIVLQNIENVFKYDLNKSTRIAAENN